MGLEANSVPCSIHVEFYRVRSISGLVTSEVFSEQGCPWCIFEKFINGLDSYVPFSRVAFVTNHDSLSHIPSYISI